MRQSSLRAFVRRYSFNLVNAGNSCILFARANHQLVHEFVETRGKSAQNWQIDCSECISPHNIAA